MAELALAEARTRRDILASQLRQPANGDVVPSLPQLLDGLLAEDVDVATALAGLHDDGPAAKPTSRAFSSSHQSATACADVADGIV
jgi:hypothetical protein